MIQRMIKSEMKLYEKQSNKQTNKQTLNYIHFMDLKTRDWYSKTILYNC